MLHDYAGGVVRTKLVSALDIVHALARQVELASGVLPSDTLCWARTAAGERIAVWREPRVWTVRLRERYDAPPHRLRLPMPGLVFICLPARQAPYVFAGTGRPKRPEDELYHCPTYNVFSSGRVCAGSHAFPADSAKVPEEFFRSFFSATGDTARGKSRRHPDDVGALWAELDGRDAFPCNDLVPALRLADALQVAS
ncbi:MAG: hypothetical protein AB7U18_17100 [Dehalococcoidia bacterium]